MLYRFQFEFSDIDHGIYETLDIRVAKHPSEIVPYLLTRALAYALSYKENLEFTAGGLSDPDEPALKLLSPTGNIELWIEIGNPSARKLHKASKTANQVVVYTYKNVGPLIEEIKNNKVHRANEIQIYAFDYKFLQDLEAHLQTNNSWNLLLQEKQLTVSIKDQSFQTPIQMTTFHR